MGIDEDSTNISGHNVTRSSIMKNIIFDVFEKKHFENTYVCKKF